MNHTILTRLDPMLLAASHNGVPNDVWSGWGSVIMAVGGMVLIGLLLALIIWQVFRTAQSKIVVAETVARDEEYRKLAEQTATAQDKLASQQQRIADDMADLRERITAIERMLSEVG